MLTIHVRGGGGGCIVKDDKPEVDKDKPPPRSIDAKLISNEIIKPFEPPKFTSKLELTLSCRNLLNKDIATKSDPYCKISMMESWQGKYYEIARTETIDDNLNPEWVTKVIVNYNFETIQKMKFDVRDQDIGGLYESLGVFETTLSDIAAYSGGQFVGKLKGASILRNFGEIIIVSEEVSSCKQIFDIEFGAENLRKLLLFRNNDPFLVFYRANEDGSYSVVAKTNVAQSTQNPTWKPLVVKARNLCNGDLDRSIKIDCYDRRRNGNHQKIGTCYTTMRTFESAPLNLVQGRKNSGCIKINRFSVREDFTFLDYIRHGTQIHFVVAIDFTVSNIVHTDPKSLHFMTSSRSNPYEIALRSVGEIIQHYDNSLIYPAFGFGAKLPSGEISHQFPLNGNPAHPYCKGIEEIMDHYRNCLKTVELYGPTNFAPVINSTSAIAEKYQDGKHYFVLLIITDGIISDMRQTKHAVVSASSLPVSIIIVGVGNSKFDRMKDLDSDIFKLTVDGRQAERDIVQFVELNKFVTKKGSTTVRSQADLAKEVLAEIPQQLTGFMESRGHKPQIVQEMAPDPTVIVPTAPTMDMLDI
ncbi:copine-9-like [Bradysia coprophila]|uniref:copine-9-like n=1 Tax=Bradysia coprophila TaxID=38358 RepID=UPI00187DBCA3|nr:copine-9-like [Bradysia coprophila]XP_037030401.1 copine-9-like [Bradysia coprophila]XP_037037406.1 copine-9-like [Bradysia coprophila]